MRSGRASGARASPAIRRPAPRSFGDVLERAIVTAELDSAVEAALRQLRGTPEQALLEFRGVGRAQLPSNALGLLFHGAEHTQRHAGQAIATAKVVAGA